MNHLWVNGRWVNICPWVNLVGPRGSDGGDRLVSIWSRKWDETHVVYSGPGSNSGTKLICLKALTCDTAFIRFCKDTDQGVKIYFYNEYSCAQAYGAI